MKYRLILFLTTLLATPFIFTPTVHADTNITKSQINLISDFTLDNRANAGGTITKDYYVFPDTKGDHGLPGTIKVVDRKTCQTTSSVYISKSDYLSGLYNKWGTNYITLIGMGAQKGCYILNGSQLQSSSGCPTPPTRSFSYQGTGQGNTATFNNYVFKVAGYRGGKIGVWTSSGTRVATYIVPESILNYEPENISVDGDTGEIYINYAKKENGKRHSLWYKIDSSVFSAYTGKSGTSNPTRCNGSTATEGGTYVDPTSDPKDYYDDSKIAVRDETKKHESVESSYDGTVDTNFFGTVKEDEKGCGVFTVLNTIIEILTYGIAIAAVIGIAISGLVYLNAKDDLQKTIKAKRRIYEIIIGLVVYAVLYAVLGFLLPGGKFNSNQTCSRTSDISSPVISNTPPTIS